VGGKKRLDQVEDRIAQLERARGGDVIDTFLRSLTDQQFAELRTRLEAGEAPETVLKEMTLR
jgi:predicted ArsR family transcriptional regulator